MHRLRVSAKPSEALVCVSPIYFALSEQGEGRVVAFTSELLDFQVGARLLTTELVAGEGKNFETLVPILLVQIC